jgi:hypothetical protein
MNCNYIQTMFSARQQVSLFHLLIVVPILLVVGIRIVRDEKITDIEGVLLLILASLAGVRHIFTLFAPGRK